MGRKKRGEDGVVGLRIRMLDAVIVLMVVLTVMVVLFLVSLQVFHHVVFPYEPLAAGVACVGFLARVKAHVPPKIGLVIELFRAYLALVGFVAGVLL